MTAPRTLTAAFVAAGVPLLAPALASAHNVTTATLQCDGVHLTFDSFPAGDTPVDVEANGVHRADVLHGPRGTVTLPLPVSANGPTRAVVTWRVDGGGTASATADLSGCVPPAPPVPAAAPVPVPATPASTAPVPAGAPVPQPTATCVPERVTLRLVLPGVLPRTGPVTLRVVARGVHGIRWTHRSAGERRWRTIGHGRSITVDTAVVATRTTPGHRRKGWQQLRVTARGTCGTVVRKTARVFSVDPR